MTMDGRVGVARRARGGTRAASRAAAVSAAALLLGAVGAFAQGSSQLASPEVTFASPGIKSVTLEVCNEHGCSELTRTVTVLDPYPSVTAIAVPAEAVFGQTVALAAASAGRPPLTHRWSLSGPLGDVLLLGNPAAWVVPILPATYQVRVEVSNGSGAVTSATTSLTTVAATFADVPGSYWSSRFVEALHRRGVRAACATDPLRYCPEEPMTRGSMALFLLGAKEGGAYEPPPCTTPVFADVPCSDPLAPWINELARRGVTAGCRPGDYCPEMAVSRAQMAVFLLATLEGAGWAPPACSVAPFTDMPCSSPFAPWIRELAARGITAGCGNGAFCAIQVVTRGQMAVFVATTFALP
jgi:hypothetical protein